MDTKLKNLQRQYQGYLNTPLLWENKAVLGLEQLKLPEPYTIDLNERIEDNVRLGKRVERFVHSELNQHENIEILLENTQIKQEKITIGEIDCILKQNDMPIHLEIIYKFYLYDPQMGSTEIEHWIGPNRKDSLEQKLNKLKEKQLPLIYKFQAKKVLDGIHVKPEDIIQRVCFKAQLFTPYQEDKDPFDRLNKSCLRGFYINYANLDQISQCQFYIPTKADWLIEVHKQVNWISILQFKETISPQIHEKRAPLCWIKYPNGVTSKFFVVWWGQ